ncbi:hypothetical protein FS827_28290 [Agrobacterium vitis]|nr:hypothetical protein [Allorhizobium ampelinum]
MPPRLIGSRWQSIGPGTIGLHLKGRNAVEDGQGEAFLMMDTPTTTAENIGRDQSNVGKETGCPG